jgi:hypothetical protein
LVDDQSLSEIDDSADLRSSSEQTTIGARSYRYGWLMFTINGFLTEHEETTWILSCSDGNATNIDFGRPDGPWPRKVRVQVVAPLALQARLRRADHSQWVG